jgi:magnesium-transporting ATPase (P-type)
MSGTSVTPPWLKEDVYSAPVANSSGYSPVPVGSYVPPQPAGVPSSSVPQQSGSPLPAKLSTVLFTLKITTILLCILMDATAIIGIGYINQVDEVGQFFVAAYMLFFASILMAFEIMSFRKIEWIDHWFRRNCGFLYSSLGKALFIIFIAFLSFGLGDPESLTLSTGLALAAFGSLQVGLYLKYPEIFEEKVEVLPPTVSL